MKIYGQKTLFGAFVRKTGSETSEFLRTNAIFAHFVRNCHFFEQVNYGQRAHFHRCVRKRQCFCQMQCSLNQRAKLSGKFTAKLFWVISIITGACHAYAKSRIRFAIDCKSDSFFQFEASFFSKTLFYKNLDFPDDEPQRIISE